jgi:hypothetical protein
LVEQMTVNHWVAGSSPAGGAKFQKALQSQGFFFVYSSSKSLARNIHT